jgi:hypothetical protein
MSSRGAFEPYTGYVVNTRSPTRGQERIWSSAEELGAEMVPYADILLFGSSTL